ncbi:MAG: hypothetical protein KAY24_19225, partial [Candidatus Eisenbacteria sp.]|nr:hypothetical protein [Candidatus Eisenbacteria bacterium]
MWADCSQLDQSPESTRIRLGWLGCLLGVVCIISLCRPAAGQLAGERQIDAIGGARGHGPSEVVVDGLADVAADHLAGPPLDPLVEAQTDSLLEALTDSLLEGLTDSLLEALTDSLLEALTDSLPESLTDFLSVGLEDSLSESLADPLGAISLYADEDGELVLTYGCEVEGLEESFGGESLTSIGVDPTVSINGPEQID